MLGVARGDANKVVDPDRTAQALAKAVFEGDIVNMHFLFGPFSPARQASTERFESARYLYLLPDADMLAEPWYDECLAAVKHSETMAHINSEFAANRPAQLPSELVLILADNAVALGKYTSAAQAYELLRIRGRMQDLFLGQADAALDAGDVPKAVRGYLTATGLAYDYAAYPEPLPAVPNFPARALMLHAEYPDTPDKCVAMQETDTFVQTALTYLLLDAGPAARLDARPLDTRLEFLAELVHRRDLRWDTFVDRYTEAVDMMDGVLRQLRRQAAGGGLAEEIGGLTREDPRAITARLLGRTIEGGDWWQYLKELAYEHPPAVLFVSRLAVGEHEILAPCCRAGSRFTTTLGLLPDARSRQGIGAFEATV